MGLGRRDLLKTGMAGAGLMALPGTALAAPKSISVAGSLRAPAGISPLLFERAKAALDRHGARIRNRDRIGIVDYTQRSDERRFHIVDLASGNAEHFLVSHGSGSDRNHNGFLDHFSNREGSNASSSGTYLTANRYHGKYGLSMKLHGLDDTNSNAFSRYIVMHPAWYAEADMVTKHGKLGRSQGCFALGQRDHWSAMNLLGDGRMIYADKLG
ncbi:murein L,D-transpeptidase catalytic domain family protein [Sphingomicrobium sp. XHP0235]|uniref:murein L,D-transpeptidase catalytic domain family protein n=1 Tax=Sphingomicrobium aquimarinum TaxID=3133971 RepID=UPI0031FEC48D